MSAIALLAHGKTDTDTAEMVGVNRHTIQRWRDRDPLFRAELNRQRTEQWAAATEHLRSLVGRAVDVLAADLHSDNPKVRRAAAVHVLRAVRLYGTDLQPDWPTSVTGVLIAEHLSAMELQAHIRRLATAQMPPPPEPVPPRPLPAPRKARRATVSVEDECEHGCDDRSGDGDG